MLNNSLTRLTPAFTVQDPLAFIHWIDAIPGVRAFHLPGDFFRLLVEHEVPAVREDHAGCRRHFDFVEELQIHLSGWSARALMRSLLPCPPTEAFHDHPFFI